MKRTEAISVGNLIDRIMDETGNRRVYDEQRLCYLWPEIVGPTVNRYTLKRYVCDGVLHVHLTSAPLKSELMGIRQELTRRLNEAVGAEIIKEIAFH